MPSNTVAIEVEDLSKRYRIGLPGRTRLTEWSRGKGAHLARSEYWALRDLTFALEAGKVLGIVGRNGSGKSTLLKILARITPPTQGRARIRGRVASLIEVGTGFHTELTGRENIHLSAAIMGMDRSELRRRLDDIIDFSGVGPFIDTPVKRYSSGMYVRLGFAVAAFLDPDVFLVDEVLAVGDYAFRQQCLARMNDLANSGKTILIVSHDIDIVRQLSDVALWIDAGRLAELGDVSSVISRYLERSGALSPVFDVAFDPSRPASYTHLSVRTATGFTPTASYHEPLTVMLKLAVREVLPGAIPAVQFRKDGTTVALYSELTDAPNVDRRGLEPGLHTFTTVIPASLLAPGRYTLSGLCVSPQLGEIASASDVCSITLVDVSSPSRVNPGVVGSPLTWSHRLDRWSDMA